MDEDVRNKKRKDAERHYQFGLVFVRRKNSLVYKIEAHEGEEDCDNHSPTVNVRSAIPVDLKVSLRDKAIKWLEILLGVATFVVLVYYTHATFIQSEAAIKSAIAASRSADEAKNANDFSRDALVSVQRAFIIVNPVPVIQGTLTEVLVHFNMENTGTTPTRRLKSHINYMVSSQALPKDFIFRDVPMKDRTGEELVPVIGPKSSSPLTATVSIADWRRLERQEVHIYFYGWVTYNDIFEKTPRHLTRFCFEVVSVGMATVAIGQEGAALRTDIISTRFNCYDEECKEQPHE